MKSVFVLLWITALSSLLIDAARILAYFPVPSISHQLQLRPLTEELARRGHEVVVITTDPAFPKGKGPPNFTEVDIHDTAYEAIEEYLKNSVIKEDKDDVVSNVLNIMLVMSSFVDKELYLPEVRHAIFGQKYDLLLLQVCVRSSLAISHFQKVPVIMISTLGAIFSTAEVFGIPTHPILYPSSFHKKLYNLTYWDKIKASWQNLRLAYLFHNLEYQENQMLKKHFEGLPPLSELYNNVELLFLNQHPIFEGNYPVPPNVVYIWGINDKPQKPLPEELKTYLDSSTNGVIYVSFGTNTDPTLFNPEKIARFVKVFCQLRYDVLWKWKKDELPGQCKNIKIGKWFPQADLLKHPKVKLFITQAGIQSTGEAIRAGVPMVGIPQRADQWFNVNKYVHLGIGVHLDFDTMTEDMLKDAVMTVLSNDSYRENIRKLDTLMRDEPMKPMDRAVWWVEYVLRHGGARHLRASAHNISWWQYLELNLILTLFGILFVTLVSLRYLFRAFRTIVFKINMKQKEN